MRPLRPGSPPDQSPNRATLLDVAAPARADGVGELEWRSRLNRPVGFTSFDAWSARSAPGNGTHAGASARAHRFAWGAVHIPAPFQYGPSLDRAESKQVCAPCHEAFRSRTA